MSTCTAHERDVIHDNEHVIMLIKYAPKLWWTDDLIKRDVSEMYRNNDPDATLYANAIVYILNCLILYMLLTSLILMYIVN